MAKGGKGNGSKDNSTESGSQMAEFPEKNVGENKQKDGETQEQKEFSKNVTDHQKNKGIDVNEIKGNTPEAKTSKEKMNKDGVLNVSKDNQKVPSVTPVTSRSTVKVKKDQVIREGGKIEKPTSTTPMVTRSTKKMKKDEVFNLGKDSRKVKIGIEAGEKSKLNSSPAKNLFENKTKVDYKATNKAQILKSPANAYLRSPRSKESTGVQVLKSPASADSLIKSATKRTLTPKAFFTSTSSYKSRLPVQQLQASKLNTYEGKQILDPKKTESEAKMKTSESLLQNPILKDVDERKQMLVTKETEPGTEMSVSKSLLQDPKLKGSEDQKQVSDSDVTDFITEKITSKLSLQDPKLKDIDEQKQDSDLIEIDSKAKVSICKPLLQDPQFKDIEDQKQLLDSQITDPKIAISASKPLLQDPMVSAIDENLKNLDLNTKMEHVPSSEEQYKLNELKNNENEKIINLERHECLSFEFDEHGNKTILVDDKVRYDVYENQKITFNLEVNAQISFIGSKVSISTQVGQIDCLMQRNRFVFSLADSSIKSDPLPDGQRTTEVQRNLQDTFNSFVTNVKTTCDNLEYRFLKSLK